MDSFEEIVAQISAEKPWRGVLYWVFFLVWRWSLTIFTVLACLASRQNEVVAIFLILISIFLDYRYVPNAPAFRLSDTEFVRKICRGQYIVGDDPQIIRFWFVIFVLLAFLGWAAIYIALYGMEQFEYGQFVLSQFEVIFVFVSFFYPFLMGASLIVFCDYFYPPRHHPIHITNIDYSKNVESGFGVRDYAKRGYIGDINPFMQYKTVFLICFLFMMPLTALALEAASSIADSFTKRLWVLSLSLILMSACIACCSATVMSWKSRSIAKRYIQLIDQRSGQG